MLFDFDEWARLARDDSARFERLRRAAVEAKLAQLGGSQRLVALQFRLDLERRRARTPLKSWQRLSGLMWQSLYRLNDRLNAPAGPRRLEPLPWADVVDLAGRRTQPARLRAPSELKGHP